MEKQKKVGWHKLFAKYPWFKGEGKFPFSAYSEFMPPPRLGKFPYGETDTTLFSETDPFGWTISEIEEEYELKPGCEQIGKIVMSHLLKLAKGETEHHITGHGRLNVKNNPYWPEELADQAGKLIHERFVSFLPFMLSRTQDDKGRVRWTYFGGSIEGPEMTFWNSFFTAPGQEVSESKFTEFISALLVNVFNIETFTPEKLIQAGFRILPCEKPVALPSWVNPYKINMRSKTEGIKYLLTFRPFSELPEKIKTNYLKGKLALLPFPGSLVFWGMPTYLHLQKSLPSALQIPMLRLTERHRAAGGLRISQSGWFEVEHPDNNLIDKDDDLLTDNFQRTHRWQRVLRHQNDLEQSKQFSGVAEALFSADLESMGLYNKPMVRNSQIWTKDFNLIIDGPNASPEEIYKAKNNVADGGLFGYRFFYPPMMVGEYQVYWHRPVVAYKSFKTDELEILPDSLSGYLACYRNGYANPVKLWPRMSKDSVIMESLHGFEEEHDYYANQTALNISNIFDVYHHFGKTLLPRTFAHRLLRINKKKTLEEWLDELIDHHINLQTGRRIRDEIIKIIEPADRELPEDITYQHTANRSFEEAWWNDIHFLAHGIFINTDNADCVLDEITQSQVNHNHRDLEALGDYLMSRHRDAIEKVGMKGKAFCGEIPFKWDTSFDLSVYGGWKQNFEGQTYERNILVVIPGKNRKQAVVMADHYDTAYMEDVFDKERGGTGARISANGADDNFSATTTLLLAAPIFLQLAKEGKLERDIWLLHLTGEEFPADCMGARHFAKSLVEKTLQLTIENNEKINLADTEITGVFVMDMIGHNRDDDQDTFQISPGRSAQSLRMAYQAHIANCIWNVKTKQWNKSPDRYGCKPGKRTMDGLTIPEKADHLALAGEVRTHLDPASSLFNTDCQVLSDIGAPVVLFMENYDISRSGYHDTKDTMENIDLDYGAALAAICIETIARVSVI
jgi:hypothetical protein